MNRSKTKIDPITIFMVLAVNAVPLYGVIWEGWNGIAVISLYLLETVVIGTFHALRMFFYKIFGVKPTDKKLALGMILFFMFHFFFFVFVQAALFFGFVEGYYPGIKNGFEVVHNFSLFLQEPYLISFYFFVSAQLVYSFREMIYFKTFEKLTSGEYMFLPYSRIFIQQFVVIFGAMVFLITRSVIWVVILLILFKTLAEYLGMRFGVEWISYQQRTKISRN